MKPLRLRAYAVGATAARTADESVGAGLALAAGAIGMSSTSAGLLIGSTTAVHAVAGPFVGVRLDSLPARRGVIVAAPITFAAILGLVFVLLDVVPLEILMVMCVTGGAVAPVLLGGLSAALIDMSPAPSERALRLDAITYNVAAISAPLLAVAVVDGLGAAWVAALLLTCGVAAAGALAQLPIVPAPPRPQRRSLDAVAALWRRPRLRATTLATTVAFLGVGGIPLTLVARSKELGSTTITGVALASAAVAGLAAATLPLRTERAGRRVVITLAIAAGGLAVAAVAPNAALLVAGLAITGAADGALLPAVLAVRSQETDAGDRGAVFTTAASLKIAAGAAGAALTGLALDQVAPQAMFCTIAGIHAAGAAIAVSTTCRASTTSCDR